MLAAEEQQTIDDSLDRERAKIAAWIATVPATGIGEGVRVVAAGVRGTQRTAVPSQGGTRTNGLRSTPQEETAASIGDESSS